MRSLITMCLLTSLTAATAQIPDISGWRQDSIPQGTVLNKANNSMQDWTFQNIDGRWQVVRNEYKREKGDAFLFGATSRKELQGNRFVLKVDDGYLVGMNHGEYGGGLYFIDSLGRNFYEIAGRMNIVEIFHYNNKLFAIEGLAHLGGQRGQVLELYKDNTWQWKSLTRLVEAPLMLFDYSGEKYIVTSQYILRFSRSFKVTEVLKSPFYWGILYPSAALVNEKDLYLAMRRGVLKIETFDSIPKFKWYLPD